MFGSQEKGRSLEHGHSLQEIRERLEVRGGDSYLGDAILGAIDGCVTTFAIVVGAMGGRLSAGVALILGAANLIADGVSMAVSNFQKAKSERELIDRIRKTEERHVEEVPEGEREEIRQIFEKKGFEDPILSEIVDKITRNRTLWIDTMLTEEYGLALKSPSVWRSAWVTFWAFIFVGGIPLVPFFFTAFLMEGQMFLASFILTGVAFFGVGVLRGKLVHRPLFLSGLETFLVGGVASGLAYGVAHLLRGFVAS
ncbi:MAG: VIT1/CCC1 transporter family protein [Deltaproteobacteria bacterium]|nr:VIT1/CCC1 transporter family protein [Deltaproteobacteria bacterium]